MIIKISSYSELDQSEHRDPKITRPTPNRILFGPLPQPYPQTSLSLDQLAASLFLPTASALTLSTPPFPPSPLPPTPLPPMNILENLLFLFPFSETFPFFLSSSTIPLFSLFSIPTKHSSISPSQTGIYHLSTRSLSARLYIIFTGSDVVVFLVALSSSTVFVIGTIEARLFFSFSSSSLERLDVKLDVHLLESSSLVAGVEFLRTRAVILHRDFLAGAEAGGGGKKAHRFS